MPLPIPTQIVSPAPVAQTPLSADDVRRWLIMVERGAAKDQGRTTSPGTHKVWKWPDIYVKDTDVRNYLKAWVWCKAHGHSFKEICRSRVGWSVRTGQRKVDEAIAVITARLAFDMAAEGGGVLVTANALEPVNLKLRPLGTLPVAPTRPDPE